jgi:hypothetical protein
MPGLTVEIIPDTGQGGFTARVPDIPAYGEGSTEDALARVNPPASLRKLDLRLEDLARA